ncbi:MAG: hypothetical protein ACP5MM_09865, partial [Acidithiobacillus sp.]|uniref:hypothetical protein n=1 Tax=Acidithiobacillus sp. TaxID=1872118 RepID=UPI003D06633A
MRYTGEYKSFRASAAAALRRALPGRAWLATAFGIAVAAASLPSAVSIMVPVPAGVAGGVMQALPLRATAAVKKPGAIATAENEAYSRVQVNDSFGAMDLLRQARRLLRSGHIAHALNAYQKAIDRYGNKVVRVQHGQYVTVSDEVSRLILSLP